MKFKISFLLWLRDCWRIIKYSAKRYAGDQLSQQAVVLAYYTLFAIVPMVALLFGIGKGFGLENMVRNAVYDRFQAQHEMLDYVWDIAEKTLNEASGGVVAGVGIAVLLWTVIWLITNIERAFNVVWGLAARRNTLRKFSSYLSLVLLAPLLMVMVNTLGNMLNGLQDLRRAWKRGQGFLVPVVVTAVGFILTMLMPLSVSRMIFTLCGIVILVIGLVMIADRLKKRLWLDDGSDPNIIDAL
jgi:membrane protein